MYVILACSIDAVFVLQWSYGVTCWEVYTGGKGPYPGIHPVELPRKLDMGYRMEKPLNAACTNEMYEILCMHYKLCSYLHIIELNVTEGKVDCVEKL